MEVVAHFEPGNGDGAYHNGAYGALGADVIADVGGFAAAHHVNGCPVAIAGKIEHVAVGAVFRGGVHIFMHEHEYLAPGEAEPGIGVEVAFLRGCGGSGFFFDERGKLEDVLFSSAYSAKELRRILLGSVSRRLRTL